MSQASTQLHALSRPFSFHAWLPLVAVLVTGAIGFFIVQDVPLLLDERRHYPRICEARDGVSYGVDHAVCPHTYHVIVAAASTITGVESVAATRLLTAPIALLCVVLTISIARKLGVGNSARIGAQLFFLPVLTPFFFLLYTDALSLLFVLLALRLTLSNCLWGAALAASAAVLVRQTMIIWMMFVFVLPYVRAHGLRMEWQPILHHLRRSWLYLVGFAGFAVFLIVNRGVALGDKEHHPAFELRAGNISFALLLAGVVFLPLHIANIPRILTLLRTRPWVLPLVLAGVTFLWQASTFDHPYNQKDDCLRNWPLVAAEMHVALRLLFFTAVTGAILSLCVTRLREPAFLLLYPLVVLSLAPSWLIEPRYVIPAFGLFVLFRQPQAPRLERAQLAWSALLALAVLAVTFDGRYFL